MNYYELTPPNDSSIEMYIKHWSVSVSRQLWLLKSSIVLNFWRQQNICWLVGVNKSFYLVVWVLKVMKRQLPVLLFKFTVTLQAVNRCVRNTYVMRSREISLKSNMWHIHFSMILLDRNTYNHDFKITIRWSLNAP